MFKCRKERFPRKLTKSPLIFWQKLALRTALKTRVGSVYSSDSVLRISLLPIIPTSLCDLVYFLGHNTLHPNEFLFVWRGLEGISGLWLLSYFKKKGEKRFIMLLFSEFLVYIRNWNLMFKSMVWAILLGFSWNVAKLVLDPP